MNPVHSFLLGAVLILETVSNASAQTPVYGSPVYRGGIQVSGRPGPGPGPVYNPGPVYPSYPSYPSYPNNNGRPCTISTIYNGAYTTYSATDGYGSLIASDNDYYDVYQAAVRAQQSGSCSGIINISQNNGSYPGSYQPQGQSFCQIMPGGNAYGQQFYRVISRSGAILLNTGSYAEAQNEQRTDARCYQ